MVINKNMKPKAYEHGEVTFVEISKLPDGLEPSKTNVFAKGNTGNSHTFKGGTLYLKKVDTYVYGYFVAKNTKLYHPEHSPKGASIPDGIYELRRQVEYINGEMRPVID